ncbi:MAG: hypothetical protein AMXMBFR64_33260 [Myxococcales bacterium]
MALVLIPLRGLAGQRAQRAVEELVSLASFEPRRIGGDLSRAGELEVRPEPLLVVPFEGEAPLADRLTGAMERALRRGTEWGAIIVVSPALRLPRAGDERDGALAELDEVWRTLEAWLDHVGPGLGQGTLRLVPWAFTEQPETPVTAPSLFAGPGRRAIPLLEGTRDGAARARTFERHGLASLVATMAAVHAVSASGGEADKLLGAPGTGVEAVEAACALLDAPVHEALARARIAALLAGKRGVPDPSQPLGEDAMGVIAKAVATRQDTHRRAIGAVFDAEVETKTLRAFRGRSGGWLRPGAAVDDPRDPGAANLVLPHNAAFWTEDLAQSVEAGAPQVLDQVVAAAVTQATGAFGALAKDVDKDIRLAGVPREAIGEALALLDGLAEAVRRRRPTSPPPPRFGVPDAARTARQLQPSWLGNEGGVLSAVATVPTRLAARLEVAAAVLGFAAAAWVGTLVAGVQTAGTAAAIVGGVTLLGALVGVFQLRSRGAQQREWGERWTKEVEEPGVRDATETVGGVLVRGAEAVAHEVRYAAAGALLRDVAHARSRLIAEVAGLRRILQQEHLALDSALHVRAHDDEEAGRFSLAVGPELIGEADAPPLDAWLRRLDRCVTLSEPPTRITRDEHLALVRPLLADLVVEGRRVAVLRAALCERARRAVRWASDSHRLPGGPGGSPHTYAIAGVLVAPALGDVELPEVLPLEGAVSPGCLLVVQVRHRAARPAPEAL